MLDTSVDSQEGSHYAPGGGSTGIGHEESDLDDVQIIEKPPKKRARGGSADTPLLRVVRLTELLVSLPTAQDTTPFVQGSSKDHEVDGLAQRLTQSTSFDESHSKTVWHTDDAADLWNF